MVKYNELTDAWGRGATWAESANGQAPPGNRTQIDSRWSYSRGGAGFADGFVLVGASDTQTGGDSGMCFFEADPVIYQGGVMGRDIPKLFSFAGCVVCFMTGWSRSISWI